MKEKKKIGEVEKCNLNVVSAVNLSNLQVLQCTLRHAHLRRAVNKRTDQFFIVPTVWSKQEQDKEVKWEQ